MAQNRVFTSRHVASSALEFLRLQAPKSEFYATAVGLFDGRLSGSYNLGTACFRLAEVMDSWTAFVEAGLGTPAQFEVRARVAAATEVLQHRTRGFLLCASRQ